MKKMALLLATDDLKKMDVMGQFLDHNDKVIWRTRGRFTANYLNKIPFPINLYFFYRSNVYYRARCTEIFRGDREECPLSLIPPEYRNDHAPYTMFILIDHLGQIEAIPISKFPKWNKPSESYTRGNQGLFRVQDILAS